ncbi:16S rRNA (uracil(1498)-N(3))-methyltransferase [Moraxella sp. ZJ142]|uniref:16S rRNA (uracil(1498)-N(3))-methyltransferase n=1 Tax=Moraxella marmotae TaxID=3344520 RepID=UPI0035D4A6CA
MNVILLDTDNLLINQQAVITNPKTITHICSVLGAGVGDELKVGQLGGWLGRAIISAIDDNQVQLSKVCLDTPPPPKLDLTVVLALPRPKVLRRLMMDMTAMGVRHIVLVNSFRTDKSYWSSPLLNRSREYLIEGLEQGVDTQLPQLTFAKRFKPFVQDELPTLIGGGRAVVAHPYASHSFADLTTDGLPTVLVVGAEGGFIPYEIELLGSVGVQAASLGSRILRTESAVNALLGRWLA